MIDGGEFINIVSYGGGANSTALLVGLHQHRIPVDLILFADTGGEHPHTYAYLDIMDRWLKDHGMPEITRVYKTTKDGRRLTLEDECLKSGTLPSIAYGFKRCSLKHKIGPQEKFCNNYPPCRKVWVSGKKVVKFIGYDAGEHYRSNTQLPNGTVVEVIGTDGDWYMIRLPEKIGYVYSGYMTLSDTGGEADGGLSLSIDPDKLSELLEQLMGGSGGVALTPDGNLSLIDDIGSSTRSGKQFITVETKNGNVFYIIIDRDDEGEETVHFLNQVDEADLLTLMGDDAPAAETIAICNCKEKCVAGAVNTNCPVCKNNLSECSGKEVVAEPEPEAEQPEKKSSGGLLVIVLLLALAGGGAFAYVKFIKPKQGVKVSADPDDYDFEDEEYLTEDESGDIKDN